MMKFSAASWSTALLLGLFCLATTVVVQAQNPPTDIIRFSFRFGFFDDDETPQTEVVRSDVEAVLCQTQYFLSKLLQNATNTKSVHAKATEINWGYYKNDELPAHINFTVIFTDPTTDLDEQDQNWMDDTILIREMERIGEPGLKKFIEEWVWQAEPIGQNFFSNANRIAYDGVRRSRVEGELDDAECPTTEAPTLSPTVSPAPTAMSEAPTTAAQNLMPPQEGDDEDGAGMGNETAVPEEGAGEDGGIPSDDNSTLPLNGVPDEDFPHKDIPDGVVHPNNPNARDDWPFGPNYESVIDLDDMVSVSLQFHMFEDKEKPPAESDVNALLCQINNFMTQTLRRKLLEPTLHAKATYVNYYFNEAGVGDVTKEDIVVNYTAFVYYADQDQKQAPAQDVFDALKLTNQELKMLVEDYVWKSEPQEENLFYHTEAIDLKAETGLELTEDAMMVEAHGCILPEMMPDNDDNDNKDDENGENGDNDNGTGGAGNGGDENGDEDDGTGDGDTFVSLGPDAKTADIRVSFRVSNLEKITDPAAIKASGLDASWPTFTSEMVSAQAAKKAANRLRQLRVLYEDRVLRVVSTPQSAEVDQVQEYPCPGNALPGLTCHSASATYQVRMSDEENEAKVQDEYQDATQSAVDDGTYNDRLQEIDPETPLYIGIMTDPDQIPPGSRNRGYDGEEDDDGWFKWWYLLLLLLALLLCCLCCLFCLSRRSPKDTTTTEEYYEKDVLVEEFDDENAPGGADAHDRDFVDDDPNAGTMVPYAASPAPAPYPGAPPPGQMVPYQDDHAAKDRAERERIMNNSQQWEEDK